MSRLFRRSIQRNMLVVCLTCTVGSLTVAASYLQAIASPQLDLSSLKRIERRVLLMGTYAELVTFSTDRQRGLQELGRMLKVLEAAERELSTWRDDSIVTALNRQPVNVPWVAPPPLCSLLAELVSWHRETRGAFDPAIGALVAAWGLREGGRHPTSTDIETALRHSGLQHIFFDPRSCSVTRRRNVWLDAGAFGKGEALDRLLRLEDIGLVQPWIADLGGQIMVKGMSKEGWPIALAHPQQRDETVAEIHLTRGSLATTGGSERDVSLEGRSMGHILDPRTGFPITRKASAVVWHQSALVADVLSTALYVMGVEEGLRWAEIRGVAACFIVPEDEVFDTDVTARTGKVTLRPTTNFSRCLLHASGNC